MEIADVKTRSKQAKLHDYELAEVLTRVQVQSQPLVRAWSERGFAVIEVLWCLGYSAAEVGPTC